VRDGRLAERDVRRVTVTALVDTGAGTLVISEELRQKLGLEIQGLRRTTFGDGRQELCRLTEPVEVRWRDRSTTCQALV